MLTGDIKRHVELESTRITTYQQLRSTIMNWAIGQLERERKSDDMDIGAASGEQESNDEDSWNLACTIACEALGTAQPSPTQEEESSDNSIHAMGKGKGQGKGGKFNYPPGIGRGERV